MLDRILERLVIWGIVDIILAVFFTRFVQRLKLVWWFWNSLAILRSTEDAWNSNLCALIRCLAVILVGCFASAPLVLRPIIRIGLTLPIKVNADGFLLIFALNLIFGKLIDTWANIIWMTIHLRHFGIILECNNILLVSKTHRLSLLRRNSVSTMGLRWDVVLGWLESHWFGMWAIVRLKHDTNRIIISFDVMAITTIHHVWLMNRLQRWFLTQAVVLWKVLRLPINFKVRDEENAQGV
jgi:hypothetical protein